MPDRSTGRVGSELWPPRSSNLTPFDFVLWDLTKSKIYDTLIDSTEALKRRIKTKTNRISQETLKKGWDKMKLRQNYISQNVFGTN